MTSAMRESSAPELRPEMIAKGDPLLKRLVRLNVSPVILGVAYSVTFNLLRMLAARRVGHLHTAGTITGFFDDPAMYTNLVMGAVIWTYYTWLPGGIAAAVNGLLANNAIGAPTSTTYLKKGKEYSYASFMDEIHTLFGKWWWSAASLVIAVTATFVLLLPGYLARMSKQDSASMADPLSLTLSLLWVLIGLYSVVILLIYCALGIFWLRRLFTSFTANVRPLHPDRAGGLSPLGKFSLTLSYIITLIGLLLVTTPTLRHYLADRTLGFQWTTDILVGLGIYVIAAPIAFFAPLSVAHSTMQNAKSQLLLQIAQRFEVEYTKVQSALGDDISSLESSLKTLKELQSLHEIVTKFPVWPFNAENVARFTTSSVTPIVLAVLTDLLKKLVTP